MAYTVAPAPYHQFFDDDGAILAGGKVYTYEAGTSTALDTYSDSSGTANANPIVLDSAGCAKIFLSANSYKFVIADSDDVTIRTIDAVSATPAFDVDWDVAATAGEALSAGNLVYLSDGSGSRTAGRWYKADSDPDYMSIRANAIGMLPADIASGASGTVRLGGRVEGLSGMAAGSVYYPSATAGAITATAPTYARPIGVAESATVLVLSPWMAPALQARARTYTDTTAVGNIGAGADYLIQYVVPANTLAVDGQSLRINCWGTTANNADAKTIKAYFNDSLLLTASMTVNQASQWQLEVILLRTGAATQVGLAKLIEGTASAALTLSIQEISAPAQTLSLGRPFRLTGEGTTTDDIIQSGLIVRAT